MTTLYNKIVLGVLLIVSVTVAAVSTVAIWAINTRISPDIEQLTMDSMNAKVSEIDLWLNYNMQSISQLAESFEDISITKENTNTILDRLNRYKATAQTHYESLGFITVDGNKYITDGTKFNVTEREYYLRLQNEDLKTVVSKNIVSLSNNKNIVLIVTKVLDSQNNVKGYISGALTVDYLKEVVSRADIYDFNAFIVNGSDNIIIGEKSQHPSSTTILFKSKIESNPDWSLVMEIPKYFIQKETIFTIFWVAVSAVAMFTASLFFVRKFAQIIASPARELEDAMKEAKSGKLVPITPDDNIKEFASLGNSYNNMLQNIEHLMDEIREKEHLKNEADNKAMYSQIKPHFLYNTLETIQAMAFDNEDEQVETAIGNLATLFRIGLSDDRQIITLKEEIDHVKSYLNIQLLRYSNIFNYNMNIEDMDLDSKFMKFTLQPIVENAIYHGAKKLPYKSTIVINIFKKGDNICTQISNTCEQIDSSKIERINQKLKGNHIPADITGYGLYNVNSRLKLNFGDEYGIKLFVKDGCFTSQIIHPLLP